MELFEKVTDILNGYRTAHRIPGIAAGIILDGEIIYTRTLGTANANTYALIDAHTLFALEDITTLFTAQAMLHLQSRTDFDLNRPIKDYLPEFAKPGLHELTAAHILAHTTGFASDLPFVPMMDKEKYAFLKDMPEYRKSMEQLREKLDFPAIRTRQECVLVQSGLPLVHQAGTTAAYDVQPFMLAAVILEQISGMTWEEYITTHILQPLRLDATCINPVRQKNATAYYIHTIGDPIEAPLPHNPIGAPISGIFSNLRNMTVFLANCLKQAEVDVKTVRDNSADFWQGWYVNRSENLTLSAVGNQLGASSYMEMVPALSLGIVLFANMDMLHLDRLAQKIKRAVMD
ncbi:serine hydrolase domain-containing protein [Virgibacillus sp. 179-BFC.A HS]|uniref:Serine hydrolase domain-containing protein n=1 Tax=Tigheibacillus jepli TaxID=3035914 RepID=A0ABU5CDF6_9BACI|nr:serine hydrolase domain-containing protein [Virgibacillus sp. 179-BFC.A HS]MDY0404374.1 serine hydrolase domain-containing protein [Virgibacillus sp. 179-BFC.A HS]